MKIGLAVSTSDAPESAFVALRDDLATCIDRCAAMGYDGVEFALRHPSQINIAQIKQRLQATGLEIPCISTGQMCAVDNLYFTHPDRHVREQTVERIIATIHLAAEFGAKVNTGRVRGSLPNDDKELARQYYLECLHRCADVAEDLAVELIIEPVNRYELNFINSCDEGAAIIRQADRSCLKLMPDMFHMNIEDASFHDALTDAGSLISYVHVADTNRLAPGWGHMPFEVIFNSLQGIDYDGWLTAEILPKPDPEQASLQAIRFLRSRFSRRTNGSTASDIGYQTF